MALHLAIALAGATLIGSPESGATLPPGGAPATEELRTGRYGAGWPGRPARSWHAWRTGTPAQLAAARI